MTEKAILVLEDGSVYEGDAFGAQSTACGEVVFDTSMTGYQEMLTDPSFAGQILVPTYPLVGNYGINEMDFESGEVQVRGLAVRECCFQPSHWQSSRTLHEFMLAYGVPGISGIDTRALTRHIRSEGAVMGILTSEIAAEEALAELKGSPTYASLDLVRQVSTERPYEWQPRESDGRPLLAGSRQSNGIHLVVVDLGLKYNILRILSQLGCRITVVPCATSGEDILTLDADGIVLSSGPGTPGLLDYVVKAIERLLERKPVMGIGLGHNLIGQAFGAKNVKLKFGHRGSYPVRDLVTGKVHITAQNHGYAIDGDTVRGELEVSHINLNDGTVEGFRHRDLPILSVQYHSEASPGPLDNMYLFERFLEMVRRQWDEEK
jgi:carbamoyl-phosphate synthase small subunit